MRRRTQTASVFSSGGRWFTSQGKPGVLRPKGSGLLLEPQQKALFSDHMCENRDRCFGLLTWVATYLGCCLRLLALALANQAAWLAIGFGIPTMPAARVTPSPKHHPQLTHMGKEGGRLGPEGRDVRRGARLMVRDAASGCLKHPGRTLCLSAGDAATPTKGCSRKGERLPLHARTRTMTPSPCSEAERGDGRKRVRRERHGCAHEGVLTQRRARRLQGTPGRAP